MENQRCETISSAWMSRARGTKYSAWYPEKWPRPAPGRQDLRECGEEIGLCKHIYIARVSR